MKKIATYCSLLVLGGCLTDSSVDTARTTISSKTDTHTSTGTSSRKNSSTTSSSTLNKLSGISGISTAITEANRAKILTAFNAWNKANSDKIISVTTTTQASALDYLAQANKDSEPLNISNMITTINALETKYNSYTPQKTQYDALQPYSLKLSTDFDSTDEYVTYLQSAVDSSLITQKPGSFVDGVDGKTATQQYIEYVEKTYFDKIKANASFTSIDGQYATMDYTSALYTEAMGKLNTKLSELDSSISTLKNEIVAKLKVLDPKVKEFPLTIDKLVKYYIQQGYILSAIKEVQYLKDISVSTSDMKSNNASISYVYNSGLEDYVIDINDGSTIEFKASDFKKDTSIRSYVATKERNNVTYANAIVFMPYLHNYLTAGGSSANELNQRRINALTIFNKIKSGTASTAEQQTFITWVKVGNSSSTYVDIEQIKDQSSESYKNLIKAIDILSSTTNCNFALSKTVGVTDSIYLGGTYTGLSYSDFGIWNKKTSTTYDGNATLKQYLSNSSAKTTNTSRNIAFFSGLESFKRAFEPDQSLDNTKYKTFTGSTIAYATLNGKSSDNTVEKFLSGSASLNVYQRDVIGNLKLAFSDFYGLSIDGIDLTNPDFTSTNAPYISTSCPSCNWIASGNVTFTGSLSGSQYGLETNKPDEIVGNYRIYTSDVNDSTKYSNVTIVGAFGVKK
ncbi:MAG: hypothetical protein K6F04_01825 [bacterium]|nr:hypothetical protein [bacterium]